MVTAIITQEHIGVRVVGPVAAETPLDMTVVIAPRHGMEPPREGIPITTIIVPVAGAPVLEAAAVMTAIITVAMAPARMDFMAMAAPVMKIFTLVYL